MRNRIARLRIIRSGGWALSASSLLSLTLTLCLALAACGGAGLGAGGTSAPPSGWTDITPNDSGQSASYTVSPDVPGLILAVIGGHAQASADPPPTARLWRSRDGGADWELLDSLNVRTSAQLIMPPGGNGLVIAVDQLANTATISLDAGTTWRALPTVTPSMYGATNAGWPYAAVVVGGRLYAGGVAAGYGGLPDGTSRFVVSDDHGQTWRTVEAGSDPAGPNMTTQSIAPLDASGANWLRIVGAGSGGPTTQLAVERSSDGGATWRVVTQALPVQGAALDAQLAFDTAHPGAVCAAVTTRDNNPITTPPTVTPPAPAPTDSSGGMAISMPPPQPKDVALLASDDGGATWRGGAVLAMRRAYGGAVQPGVQMSDDGACYLATAQAGDPMGLPSEDQLATLWRLAPGAAQPQALWALADRTLGNLFIAPGGGSISAGERLIALTRIAGPGDGQATSCGPGCETPRDAGIYRLIWQPLSAT